MKNYIFLTDFRLWHFNCFHHNFTFSHMLWYYWSTLTMWMIFNPILHCNPSVENARQDNWDSSYCIEGHLAASSLLKAGKKNSEQATKKKKGKEKRYPCLTKGKFWKINKTLLSTIRRMESKWLGHQVGFQFSSLQALFHQFHSF